MKLEASVEIERPISDVWGWYAVDHVRNHPRWNPDLKLDQITDGPMGLGTRIRRRSTMGQTPVEGEMEITEWEPPHAVTASIRDGDVPTLGGASFEERGPARTLLTISADMPWLDDPERARFIQGMMERSVANMKQMMEAEL
jgi:uncharacterized protein YndB with AHSA1/START domain